MDDAAIERQIEARLRRQRLGLEPIPPPPPPKPKPADDVEDDGPTYLSPAWHAARAAATTAPVPVLVSTPVPPVYAQSVKRRYRRRRTASKMGTMMFELQDRDRRCTECARPTDGLSWLCWRHIRRRGKYGNVKLTRPVLFKDYIGYVRLAQKYLKRNPPERPVVESMERFRIPPPAIPRGSYTSGRKVRDLLRQEMMRWNDPKYRKRISNANRATGKLAYFQPDYTPRGILAALIGITAFIEERDGQGFQGDAEFHAKAHAILRLWKRPNGTRPNGINVSSLIPPSVFRALGARLREFPLVLNYAATVARELVQTVRAEQAAKNAALARVPNPAEVKRQTAETKLAQQRVDFLALPVLTDPGPRPSVPPDMTMDIRYMRLVNEWAARLDAFHLYQHKRQELFPE